MTSTLPQRTTRHSFIADAVSIEQMHLLAIERKTNVSSLIREAIHLYLNRESKEGTFQGEIANQGA
jgi:hypothetical protein